jgi:hypothetical protein
VLREQKLGQEFGSIHFRVERVCRLVDVILRHELHESVILAEIRILFMRPLDLGHVTLRTDQGVGHREPVGFGILPVLAGRILDVHKREKLPADEAGVLYWMDRFVSTESISILV